MLRARVITAIVLLPGLLALVWFAPSNIFAMAIGAVALIAAREWAQLAGVTAGAATYGFMAAVAVLMLLLWFFPQWRAAWVILALLWWVAALYCVVRYPAHGRIWDRPLVLGGSGLLVLCATWLGIVALQARGPLVLLVLLFVVWAADVGAYFAGRAFGARKLAPRVSPGKSWEGVLGGLLLAIAIGAAMRAWTTSFASLPATLSYVQAIGTCTLIVTVSILGDLTESMLKRQRGVKDSGTLLPGHGGVLDRIDSVLATAPLWALLSGALSWAQ